MQYNEKSHPLVNGWLSANVEGTREKSNFLEELIELNRALIV
ncbi:MAG TPA: hypothetical protein VGN20_11670 [Mucilaginibacter sp.]|jgi:hypothetical protein